MIDKIVFTGFVTGLALAAFGAETPVTAGPVRAYLPDPTALFAPHNHPLSEMSGPDFNPVLARDIEGNLFAACENTVSATDHDVYIYQFNMVTRSWDSRNPGGLNGPVRDHRQPCIFYDSNGSYYLITKGPPPSTYVGVDTTLFWWVNDDLLYTVPGTGWYGHCSHPAVAANGSGLWVAMQVDSAGTSDIRVLFQPSGSTSVYTVNVAATPAHETHPSIAAGGTHVVVAYEYKSGTGASRIMAARADGQNFEDPVVIAGTADTSALDPSVAADGKNFYVAYTAGKNVGLAYSSNGGGTFTSVAIAATPGAESRPAVCCRGTKVFVAYGKDSTEVMHRMSTDGGATWSGPERVSDDRTVFVDTARAIAVACNSKDSTYVAWVDARNQSWNGWDIYSGQRGEIFPVAEGGSRRRSGPSLGLAPSPFRGTVSIYYSVAAEGPVRLCVFDAAGNLVKELERGERRPGSYRLRWTGVDNTGRTLAAGVYFINLQTRETGQTARVVLVR